MFISIYEISCSYYSAGGSQRLARLIGVSKAKELVFTGQTLTGQEAKEYGIVNHAILDKDPNIKAMEIANQMINNGKLHCTNFPFPFYLLSCSFIFYLLLGPLAISQAKEAIDRGINANSIEEGLKIEKECYSKLLDTKDRLEGLLAFSEKRFPKYLGC